MRPSRSLVSRVLTIPGCTQLAVTFASISYNIHKTHKFYLFASFLFDLIKEIKKTSSTDLESPSKLLGMQNIGKLRERVRTCCIVITVVEEEDRDKYFSIKSKPPPPPFFLSILFFYNNFLCFLLQCAIVHSFQYSDLYIHTYVYIHTHTLGARLIKLPFLPFIPCYQIEITDGVAGEPAVDAR